jgi:hypothetical protein
VGGSRASDNSACVEQMRQDGGSGMWKEQSKEQMNREVNDGIWNVTGEGQAKKSGRGLS